MNSKAIACCELCNGEARLYCDSDDAFLCFDCDSRVHNANFLVARHVRCLICRNCRSLAGNSFSGGRSPTTRQVICRSCSPENISGEETDKDSISCSSSSSALSSVCISGTDSVTLVRKTMPLDHACQATRMDSSSSVIGISGRKRRVHAGSSGDKAKKAKKQRHGALTRAKSKTEDGIFANWCKSLGLNDNSVLAKASFALGLCSGKQIGRVLPFRVSLAASLWFGLRLCGDMSLPTWQNLKRLEEVSGVPAKLIVAVELKLEQVIRIKRSQRDMAEGWAECSA